MQKDHHLKESKRKGHRKRSKLYCKVCGLKYEDFKCGYNFRNIVEFLWKDNKDENGNWPSKRLSGRLGKLHEIKLLMWNIHIEECNENIKHTTDEYCYNIEPTELSNTWIY